MAVDVQELVRVKNRILGVLLRDARQSSGRSLAECAALLDIDEDAYHTYEVGLQAPSLPQLEVLAYYFSVPLGYFWGTETLSSKRDEDELKELDEISKVDLGFPSQFIYNPGSRKILFGETSDLIENHRNFL